MGAASDSGTLQVPSLLGAVRPHTILVSMMLANNETGVIQPVGEVVKGLRRMENGRRVFVHTDAAQVSAKQSEACRGVCAMKHHSCTP